jgi:hypothetical protein
MEYDNNHFIIVSRAYSLQTMLSTRSFVVCISKIARQWRKVREGCLFVADPVKGA